jgi:PspA associated protein B
MKISWIKKKLSKSEDESDIIFSLSGGHITLETRLGLRSTGRCGISFKSTSGMQFNDLTNEIKAFLDHSLTEFNISYETLTDSFGYFWIIIKAKVMEDELAALTAVRDTVEDAGYLPLLLASVFQFQVKDSESPGVNAYLIYNHKRKNFYPFVPMSRQERNSEYELKMMAILSKEVPFENNMSLWYPLWNIPV